MPALLTHDAAEALGEIREVLTAARFDCLDLHEAVVLHHIELGFGGWIVVIGEPGNGSYEWVAKHPGSFTGERGKDRRNYSFSNEGWGGGVTCLREGLVAMADWY